MLSILVLLFISILYSSASTPWQTKRSPERDVDLEVPPSIFSPGGQLYSVQAVVQAVDSSSSSNTVLAIQCRDGVVVVTTLPQSPYFQYEQKDEDQGLNSKNTTAGPKEAFLTLNPEDVQLSPATVAPFARVSNGIVAVTAGNAVDSQVLRQRIHSLAERHHRNLSTCTLARRLADQLQIRTQQENKGRILASICILFDSNSLWRIDPTGQFYQCQAVVAGRNAKTIEQSFMKKLVEMKKSDKEQSETTTLTEILKGLSQDEALVLARDCIHDSLQDKRTRLRGLALLPGQTQHFAPS